MSDKYNRMFYVVENVGGEKVVHYAQFTCTNGEVSDDWDEDAYEATGETSVDVVDLTFVYIKVSDIVRYGRDEFYERLRYEEEHTQQYMDRLIEHEAKELIEDWCSKANHLDMWKVTEDTPYGDYWSMA